jgi:hypothetical protein
VPELVIPIFLFGIMGVVGLSFSPIGRALARRLAGEKGEPAESAALAEVDALREELQALRGEVVEMQERIDFAERLLAQVREQGKLGPGGK